MTKEQRSLLKVLKSPVRTVPGRFARLLMLEGLVGIYNAAPMNMVAGYN